MTREDAINRVKGYLTDYLSVEDVDELEEIIQALKQEPILDKIRAEIEDLDIFYDNDYSSCNNDAMFKRNDVLQIIDKYKDKYKTEMERGE